MLDALPERLRSKIDVTETCWLWRASTVKGYGQFRVGTKIRKAHVVVYELLVGPVPDGLELDHTCRQRHCVRPDHLDPVTRAENLRRSPIARSAINARKIECVRGHDLTDETNVYRYAGRRYCKRCDRIRHGRVITS